MRGLAWKPSGEEIWFTATKDDEPQGLLAVDRRGSVRTILRSPAHLWLQDVSPTGKVLLGEVQVGGGVLLHAGPGAIDKPIDDVGGTSGEVDGISWDGIELAVTDSGGNTGPGDGVDYSTYVVKTDGSAPVRLGDGAGMGISPDGKRVLVFMASAPSHLRLYPTGTGDARDIDISPVRVLDTRGAGTERRCASGVHGRRAREAAADLSARRGSGQGAASHRGRYN